MLNPDPICTSLSHGRLALDNTLQESAESSDETELAVPIPDSTLTDIL
ncbi:MAG: hypothetical protein AB8I52_11300 [Candidatus Promineifilaceae bacterium]